VFVQGDDGLTTTLQVVSGDTLYYAASRPLGNNPASWTADGSMASGSSESLPSSSQWVWAGSSSSSSGGWCQVAVTSAPAVVSAGLEYLPAADHHTRPPTSTLLGNGSTDTTVNSRTRMKSPVTAQGLQFAFANYYSVAGVETAGPSSLVLRAAVETSTGEFIPLFFQGKRDVTIDPDAQLVWTDASGFDVKRNDTYWVRTFVTMGSTHTCVSTFRAGGRESGVDIGEGSALNGTDLTTSSTIASSSFSFLYGPVRVRGKAKSTASRSLLGVIGDSIAEGTAQPIFQSLQSFIPLALNGNYAFQLAAWGSDGYFNWLDTTQAKRQRRMALLSDCTDIFCAQGVNDIGTSLGSPDLPTMQNLRAIPVWNTFYNRGKRVWAQTITPRVTSSTGYGTLGAQTATGNDSVRVAFNNWLRDGAPMLAGAAVATASNAAGTVRIGNAGHPLVGYLEVADTVESARDSGKWAIPSNLRTGTASISSASSTFTAWSGADLTTADLGRKIFIQGAGAAGAVYGGTINNIVSTSSATVSGGSAGTTVSGAVMHLGALTDDGLHPTQDGHLLMKTALNPLLATLATAA
jgi:hypothetical protein